MNREDPHHLSDNLERLQENTDLILKKISLQQRTRIEELQNTAKFGEQQKQDFALSELLKIVQTIKE